MKLDKNIPFRVIAVLFVATTCLLMVMTKNNKTDDFTDLLDKVQLFNQEQLHGLVEVLNKLNMNEATPGPGSELVETPAKRDDTTDDADQTNAGQTNRSEISILLKNPAMRFLIAFVAFLVINMVAILVHHIYMKLSKSEKSYRTVEYTLSPF